MKCEWKKIKIKDVLSMVVDNRGKTPPTQKNGYKLLEVNAISPTSKFPQYQLVRKFVSQDVYDSKFRKGHPNIGDILVPTVGTLGAVSYVNEPDCCIAQNVVALRTNSKICNRDFLYYILCDKNTRMRLLNLDIGGVQPSIKVPHLLNLDIFIPSLSEQNKISELLSCLDDKIELNNKINANLQQQAQAIFRSWFVDFEPFQNGEFVESELGPIPKGWRVGCLSELVAVKYGKDHKKLADGPYPVYGSGGIMRYVERPIYTKESVLIPRKGTLNNVIYLNEPFWSVDTMFYTEMKMENVAKYVYHFVSGKDLASMNSGSAVPSMTTDILNSMKLVIPTAEWLEKFEQILLPLYSQMFQNAAQSKTLAQLRDTLLPKLMNGEIEVQ